MEHVQRGWQIVKVDLFAWAVLTLIFVALAVISGGLSLLLYPNLLRVAGGAIDRGTGPEIGDLFRFDDLGDEILVMVLKLVADSVGLLLCIIGLLASQVAFFWAPFLALERSHGGFEAMTASWAHARGDFAAIALFLSLHSLLNLAGLLACCVGVLVTLPITVVSSVLFWRASRASVLAAADAAGVARKA